MILKEGSRGEEVKKLQTSLNLKADGIFGSQTKSKVIEFQKENKLTPDGIVGPKTWEMIGLDTDQTSISIETEYVTSNGLNINACDMETHEYPGFPTDLQAQWML